jgi:shikimate kinase
VFLEAPVEELHRRCAPKGLSRPLFRDRDAFKSLYQARISSYMKADFRVNTSGKSPSVVALEVLTILGVVS